MISKDKLICASYALIALFALPATGTAGGVTTSSSDGEFFAWQNGQQQIEWAVADSQRPGLLIDPDVITRADISPYKA